LSRLRSTSLAFADAASRLVMAICAFVMDLIYRRVIYMNADQWADLFAISAGRDLSVRESPHWLRAAWLAFSGKH
jgi:hypothetical protein